MPLKKIFSPRARTLVLVVTTVALGLVATRGKTRTDNFSGSHETPFDRVIVDNARSMLAEGRQTFRYDTFGCEDFWGGALRLHEAIEGAGLGGVGPGLSPRKALELGLKVDSDALPGKVLGAIKSGKVDLDDPAVTLQLLRANAVIGVTGFFQGDKSLRAVGIQCAICHSTVDNTVAPGIGRRLDGWANRDLDIGTIVSLAPDLSPFTDLLGVDRPTVVSVLQSWGPGKFDAELVLDGKAFRPDGKSAATLIPPAFGLAGVNLHTWTGWGSVSHWNGFVANLEMHGKGIFFDPRLNDAAQFPIAAANGFGNVRNDPDLITPKLPALHFYQLAIPAPTPPPGSFDEEAAERGDELFEGKAQCATCHVDPIYTEPGWNMHTGAEIGIDEFQAERAPDKRYRTTPLAGLWTHQKGGFFHDGRFATLLDVVNHYDTFFGLGLSSGEKNDLVEYLKSLPGDEEGHAKLAPEVVAPVEEVAQPLSAPRPLLFAPAPNPAPGVATIRFELPAAGEIKLAVFDVSGRRVRTLVEGTRPGGSFSATWDGTDSGGTRVAPGVYFYKMWVGGKPAGEQRVVMR